MITMFSLATQPQSWIKLGSDVYRLLGVSFIRTVPYALLGMLLALLPIIGVALSSDAEVPKEDPLTLSVAGICFIALSALMTPLLVKMQACAEGRTISAKATMMRSMKCLLPCLIGALLFCAAVSVGTVLLLVPGVFVFVLLSLWWSAVVVQGDGPLTAFKTSVRLVWGNWWHTAVALMPVFGITMAIAASNADFKTGMGEIADDTLNTVLNLLALTVPPMIFSAASIIIFHDLKLRQEE